MTNEVKQDYLETDPPIAGQNFVCLSFVSPDELIKKKEGFQVAKFLQSYAKDKGMEFKQVYEDYENYCYKFSEDLQRDFDKENKFQTSVRGVKIRGSYSTKEEAERGAQKLQRIDDTFHVFVGDVGAWLPWDPCADNVENEVFADTALQELMSKYKENNANKDIFYEEDKRDKIKKATEENLKEEEKLKDSENIKVEDPISEESPEEKECCCEEKESCEEKGSCEEKESCENCPTDKCPECPVETSKPSSCEVDIEPEPEPENITVDDSIKKTLEDTDPWLKDKIAKTS